MKISQSKSFITEVRIFLRIIIETIKGLKQTGLMNVVIITTMVAILSIFGCLFRSSLALSNFMNEMGNVLEVSVYIKQSANTQLAIDKIKKIKNVQRVKLTPKEKAWQNLQKQMNLPSISNPLPDTLHVKITKQEYLESAVKKINNLQEVEDVRYAKDLASKMRVISDIGNLATIIVLAILGSLTMFVISNTIQLAIQSKGVEIEIMRLMGVNNWYIKAPFIIQGGVYGLCGALLSILPLNFLQEYIDKANTFFGIPTQDVSLNIVMLSLFAMGIIFGAGGSIISVKKYLRV